MPEVGDVFIAGECRRFFGQPIDVGEPEPRRHGAGRRAKVHSECFRLTRRQIGWEIGEACPCQRPPHTVHNPDGQFQIPQIGITAVRTVPARRSSS